MAKCVHGGCNGSGFPGAKCDTCASVWCKNGNCPGSHNKKQISRSNGATCQSCRKGKILYIRWVLWE